MTMSIKSFKQSCSKSWDSIVSVIQEHPATITCVVLGILFGGIVGGIFGGGLGCVIAAAATGVGLGLLGYTADKTSNSPIEQSRNWVNSLLN